MARKLSPTRKWRSLLLGIGIAIVLVESAAAQSVEQFYRGRTITALVASQPGGVNDLVGRG